MLKDSGLHRVEHYIQLACFVSFKLEITVGLLLSVLDAQKPFAIRKVS